MSDFSLSITKWFRQNKRDLPWRDTLNPYLIWLSEIILQQTKVDQGFSYYTKFSKKYPTVEHLANADEIEVLREWQGLGYYSRARNMHYSAKLIVEEYNGIFPSNFEEILKLKGVGSYTAAAIASIAFHQKKAVVDGNVYRVLSRVFDISIPIDSGKGITHFQELADALISEINPGEHNQALMELGATICAPKNPNCNLCPLNCMCAALQNKTIALRPVKKKKTKVKNRYFHFLLYTHKNEVIIQKRDQKGIWYNMYQFPLIESMDPESSIDSALNQSKIRESEEIIHRLSHQKIHAKFHHFDSFPTVIRSNWLVINKDELIKYPLPRLIDRYLERNMI
jgi:A/G-specific adenine glycosylase